MSESTLRIRPFWNDGGPLVIAPQAMVALWEGSDPPSNGRVVEATFRWADENAPATDYDRACDVDPDPTGVVYLADSWAVVLGTAAAQSAWWLPGKSPREFYVVAVQALDDDHPDRLRQLAAGQPIAEWRLLLKRALVGAEGLLLAHAACRLSEVHEFGAFSVPVPGESEGALIGDGLRFAAPPGGYQVSSVDVVTPQEEYLTFVRFTSDAPAV